MNDNCVTIRLDLYGSIQPITPYSIDSTEVVTKIVAPLEEMLRRERVTRKPGETISLYGGYTRP